MLCGDCEFWSTPGYVVFHPTRHLFLLGVPGTLLRVGDGSLQQKAENATRGVIEAAKYGLRVHDHVLGYNSPLAPAEISRERKRFRSTGAVCSGWRGCGRLMIG